MFIYLHMLGISGGDPGERGVSGICTDSPKGKHCE